MSELLKRTTEEQQKIISRYTREIPVKLGALAKELGIEVSAATLSPGVSGEIRRESIDNGEQRYRIRINRHEKKERQRFTLAHEIAHFLLHREKIGDGLEDDVLYRSKLSNNLEYEANRFAAELIMPQAALRIELVNIEPDEQTAEELAMKFGVSKDAMTIRLGIA